MKLLLKKTVYKLGLIGDVVEVKDGYGRNYLLPHRLAVEPTEANLKAIEEDKIKYLEELAKMKEQFEAKAKLVEGKELTIEAKANEDGHLYGSIGPAQIVDLLGQDGVMVEIEQVMLAQPIRTVDTFTVKVVFCPDVEATITVIVTPEGGVLEAKPVEDEDDGYEAMMNEYE
jgi:large subunit ribosomal protein L9